MTLPASLLNDIEYVLRQSRANPLTRVSLLMRHSVRFPIVNPGDTYIVGLTEEGVRLAEELGGLLGQCFLPGRLRTSPVGRCRATVEAIARGAGWAAKVRSDRHLSHPYISPAWDQVEQSQSARANGSNGAIPAPLPDLLRWITGKEPTLGILQPVHQAVLPILETDPLLDVLVTHDTIIGAVAGGLLHMPVLGPDWPGYLEGLLFWRSEGKLRVRWRGISYVLCANFSPVAEQ